MGYHLCDLPNSFNFPSFPERENPQIALSSSTPLLFKSYSSSSIFRIQIPILLFRSIQIHISSADILTVQIDFTCSSISAANKSKAKRRVWGCDFLKLEGEIQMPEEDLVDIKFRLYDGSDIGPFRYSSASTVEMLKERIVSEWPKGKTVIPKLASEIKLINFGKILENNKTVGQCKAPFGELAGGVMVMHVVVQPSQAKTKTEKKIEESRKLSCSCSIM